MTNKTALAVVTGVVVVALGAMAVAFASDWGSAPKKVRTSAKSGATSAMRLIQYDADKDGRITRAEVDAGIDTQFRSADTTGDGKLDPAEFQKYNDARKAERQARYEAWQAKNPDAQKREPFDAGRTTIDPMKYTDWNLDGYISAEEFGGRTRSQAMRADRNGDGVIVGAEMKRGKGKKVTAASAQSAN
jgi:hypothetical protein